MKPVRLFCMALLSFVLSSCSTEIDDGSHLSESEYVDANGFFRINPPDAWRIKKYSGDPRGKVALFGPDSVEIRVLTNSVDFISLEGVIEHSKAMEQKLGITTNITKSSFNGFPSIERTFLYMGDRFWYVDFLVGNISHNLAYSASKNKFDDYLQIARLSFSTYEPHHKKLTKKEEDENYLAKMRRVGTLLTKEGELNMAAEYVHKGLLLSPDDPELNNLRIAILKKKSTPDRSESIATIILLAKNKANHQE